MQAHGISPGQHENFGGVDNVHTSTSLHYARRLGRSSMSLALDVNDNDVRDTWWRHLNHRIRPSSEAQTLTWLYKKILRTARRNRWPLNEMFYGSYGFMREYGYGVNHAISGHATHLHVGWDRQTW